MIQQERAPSLRRRLAPPRQVPRHRGFTNVESELQQLAVDARRTPGRVFVSHLPDEASDRDVDARPTTLVAALPCSVELESLAMPRDDGLGLHDDQGVLPASPQARQGHPECAVGLGSTGVASSCAARWRAAAAGRGSPAQGRAEISGWIWRSRGARLAAEVGACRTMTLWQESSRITRSTGD